MYRLGMHTYVSFFPPSTAQSVLVNVRRTAVVDGDDDDEVRVRESEVVTYDAECVYVCSLSPPT
jgi:hypothetical protein